MWESAVAIRRERGVSEFSGRGFNYSRLVFLALGWSAQTCSVNSLSRINSKLRIISSKDAPVGAPEGLNRQPHHGRLCRCAAPGTRLLSRDETFWHVINDFFPSGVLADLQQKTVTQSGRCGRSQNKDERSLNAPIWNGLSGILHRRKSFVRANV